MATIAVIGARRRRQGLGGFIAQRFAEAGGDVCAVVGTRSETAEEARRSLREQFSIDCRAYTRLEDALERERPDIVAICSPYEVHAAQLEEVARFGAHCLAEKPLVWGPPGDLVPMAREIVDGFLRRARHLAVVTQWPFTLEDFYRLHPEEQGRPVERFEMRLSPLAPGSRMVFDAAPHPLSLLHALLGPGTVEDPRARFGGGGSAQRLSLELTYRHGAGGAEARIDLEPSEEFPRPASYAINGKLARRRVSLPGYETFFESGGASPRSVSVEDPLGRLVRAFLRDVETKAAFERGEIFNGVRGLAALAAAADDAEVSVGGVECEEKRSGRTFRPEECRGVSHG